MKTIRASSLGTYNACPYKFKYGKFNWDPLTLELGNILHYYARDKKGWEIALDYYINNLNRNLLIELYMTKTFRKLDSLDEKFGKAKEVHDEVPMLINLIPDLLVTGSADRIIINEDKELEIFDWKTTASIDWYVDKYRDIERHDKPRIWEENKQPLVYSLWAMLQFGFDEATFHFVALEKKATAKMKLISRHFTKADAMKELTELGERYKESCELDMWEHKRSRYCNFKGWCCDICPNNDMNKKIL